MPMSEGEQEYDKENVNLWVDPDRKNRWQEYLEEESEYQYLSQLVRQAVERKIQHGQGDGGSVELSEELDGYFDDLRGSIDRLAQVMEEVESRLSGLEREVRDDLTVRQLANEVFEVLPSKAAVKEYELNIADGATPPDHVVPRAQAGTVDGISDTLDTEPREVRAALDRLQQDTHQVHTMDWKGEMRYYKEG